MTIRSMQLRHNNKAHGFTLIEITVVLAILALIIGSVVGGRAMIESAELRTAITEREDYKRVTHLFKEQYFALPGDMRDATAYWGDAVRCPDAGVNNGTPGTCNGDGDGIVETTWTSFGAGGNTTEGYLFWQHLMLADYLDGGYSGEAGPISVRDDVPNVNVPLSQFNGGCYHIDETVASDSTFYDIDYGANQITFGADALNCDNPVLTPKEAWSIDKKIDDGVPSRGAVIARFWNDTCARAVDGNSDDEDLDAVYNIEQDVLNCALVYLNMFGQ